MMDDDLLDVVESLTALMVEESARLSAPGRFRDFAEMAAAKLRLAARLDQIVAQRLREQPDWMAAIEDKEGLASALARLRDIAHENAAILQRNIQLSDEMMAAVAADARRRSGKSSATYRPCGSVSAIEYAAPIAVSASL